MKLSNLRKAWLKVTRLLSFKPNKKMEGSIRINPNYDTLISVIISEDTIDLIGLVDRNYNKPDYDKIFKENKVDKLRFIAYHFGDDLHLSLRTNPETKAIERYEFTSGGEAFEITERQWQGALKMQYGSKDALLDEIGRNEDFMNLPYIQTLLDSYDSITELTYQESFAIEIPQFRLKVFEDIDVGEMIKGLGYTKVKVEGEKVTRRRYNPDGTYELFEKDNVYELLEVDTSTLTDQRGSKDYAIKCWCTSTNEEHFLWVEEEFAMQGPKEAIASTFRVQADLIPHIEEISRQGDILKIIYKDDKYLQKVDPAKPKRALTWDEYNSLLVCET